MCRNLILLGHNENRQMIFICEHGTVHITHKNVTVCMNKTEFTTFADTLLTEGIWSLNQTAHWSLKELGDDKVFLRIDAGGFLLTAEEFFSLTDLIRSVLLRLRQLNFDLSGLTGRMTRQSNYSWSPN
jgi:hypothetical protein